MELLNKTALVTKTEYDTESKKVIQTSWLQHRAEKFDSKSYDARNPADLPYHPERRYHTDARLVHTITELATNEIRTCYHEHFDQKNMSLDQEPAALQQCSNMRTDCIIFDEQNSLEISRGLRGIEWAKLGYEGARKLCIS
jgi:hypothetical protein